ncbi:diacylglycerol kinase family protein [Actinomycetaceae bacterium L2_0104]
MAPSHVGIVWNPSKTSKEDLENAWREAVREIAEPRLSWFETTEDDPGRGATRDALEAGADVVVAAGGDGTVRAVAEYLAEADTDAELGIIPLGTGNLLARNLDIPLDDETAALTRVLEATPRAIDVGWAELALTGGNERHAFVVMAGFGIDAHMITETDDDLKDKAGWLAYVESLGRAVSASDVIDLRVGIDGGEPAAEKAHTLLLGNCGTLQGGVTLLPDADPSDGELDLLILDSEGITGWVDTLKNVVWDNGLKRVLGRSDEAEDSGSVRHRRLTSLSIELEEPRVFEVDGDELQETTRLEISIQPSAVKVR